MLVAVLRPGRVVAQSDVGQFNPTLQPDSHLVAGAPVVGRTGLERQIVVIVGVASPTFDERFVVRTVHPLIMTVLPLAFDTVQSVHNLSLNPSAQLRGARLRTGPLHPNQVEGIAFARKFQSE